MMRKSILLLSPPLVASALAFPLWTATRGDRGDPASPRPRTRSEPSRAAPWVQGIGFVEPVTEVRRLAFKVGGVIARCAAGPGRSFRAGDVLMELSNDEQLAAVTVAEGELRLATAERDRVLSGANPYQIQAAERRVERIMEQVRYCRREHERARRLVERNSLSSLEYDRVVTELAQRDAELRQSEAELSHLRHTVRAEDHRLMEAKVLVAQARLDLARRQCQDTILRAPFDGTILEILKREGEGALATDPVALFADTSRLRIRVEVGERSISAVKVGQRALIFGRGLGRRSFPGRVVMVKGIMGRKTIFSGAAEERKDLDVVQAMIETDEALAAPVGLEVDVKVFIGPEIVSVPAIERRG